METILSIAGKSGLYKLVSRGKSNLIVESLDETHRRLPAFATDRVTSLSDIAMYTDADDVPLWQVLENVGKQENLQLLSFNYRKVSAAERREYFSKVLPNWDQNRVHDSDIKKLLQWYDILVKNGITDFKKVLIPTNGTNIADRENGTEDQSDKEKK
jgi:dephospho-CoA kinase